MYWKLFALAFALLPAAFFIGGWWTVVLVAAAYLLAIGLVAYALFF
jgi:hypothetical protein